MESSKSSLPDEPRARLNQARQILLGLAGLLYAGLLGPPDGTTLLLAVPAAVLLPLPLLRSTWRLDDKLHLPVALLIESIVAAALPPPLFLLWVGPAILIEFVGRRRQLQLLCGATGAVGAGLGLYLGVVLGSRGLFSSLLTDAAGVSVSIVLLLGLEAREAHQESRRQELSARLEARNSMLSTLAHEVRTPLTVLQTSSALLLEGNPGELTPDQERLLRQIDAGVTRLIHFSDNLIASIKVDQGWFSLDLTPVDLRKVIKNVARHIQPMLGQRRQELKLKFPALLSRVPGDRQWLEQVMVNLIHNASKYAAPQGLIDVAVRENEQWVVVSVGDNGSGIAGDERFQVFSEFYQGNPWSSAQLKGSGLGLAIVKRVVERH